jgi:hypothetical protein
MLTTDYIQILKQQCVFRTGFRCRDVIIAFATNSSVHVEWLKYYLANYQSTSIEPAEFSVYAYQASEAFCNICQWLDTLSPSHPVKMYLDRQGMAYYVNGYFILREEADRTVAVVMPDQDMILIFSNPAIETGYLDVTRVVREAMNKKLEEKGFFLFHCGGIALDGKAILFGGGKGAGKTTSLIGALSLCNKLELISNDRVYIGDNNLPSTFRVIGFPTTITVGAGTVRHFDRLRPYAFDPTLLRYPKKALRFDQTFLELPDEEIWRVKSKLSLTTHELCQIFDCKLAPDTPLAALVFPKFDIQAGSNVTISSMSEQDVYTALNQQCFTPIDKNWPDWLSLRQQDESSLAQAARHLVDRIASQIPGYRIRFKYGEVAFGSLIEVFR